MFALEKMQFPVIELAIDSVSGLFARARRKYQSRRELDALTTADRSTIAADLGITESQLRQLAAQDNGPPQLHKMMEALKIPLAEMSSDPRLQRDMETVCSICNQKRKCRRALQNGHATAQFHAFCPNASNLDWLQRG